MFEAEGKQKYIVVSQFLAISNDVYAFIPLVIYFELSLWSKWDVVQTVTAWMENIQFVFTESSV